MTLSRVSHNPKLSAIGELRANFVSMREEFYRGHQASGFIEGLRTAVSTLEPISIDQARKVLLIGNERFVGVVNGFTERFGDGRAGLYDPHPFDFRIAIKECVDARAVSTSVVDFLTIPMIHERTAAAVVRNGFVFKVLNDFGIGFVITHSECGGEAVAHNFYTGGMRDEITKNPEFLGKHIEAIIDAVPAGIARILDPVERCKANARIQTVVAAEILTSEQHPAPVYPLMLVWKGWPAVELLWLSRSHSREAAGVSTIRSTIETIWSISRNIGITPQKQFALAAVYYDPFRLGRFNDPRVIFDLLPNSGFCVTEDFRGVVDNNLSLSPSAIGSLRYAISHNGDGHVHGIGTENGTRHIVILDPEVATLHAVKAALLKSSVELDELTKNGETISLARYDLTTRRVEFV